MDAFSSYVEARAPEPKGERSKRAGCVGLTFLGKKRLEWWNAGPHEYLNY